MQAIIEPQIAESGKRALAFCSAMTGLPFRIIAGFQRSGHRKPSRGIEAARQYLSVNPDRKNNEKSNLR